MTHTYVLFLRCSDKTMGERLPKFDSHVIDFFLDMAQKYEEELDEETYATIKDIFSKDVSPYEEQKKLSA